MKKRKNRAPFSLTLPSAALAAGLAFPAAPLLANDSLKVDGYLRQELSWNMQNWKDTPDYNDRGKLSMARTTARLNLDWEAAQDIFVMYWWPTYVTPYDYLFNLFHSEDAPAYNLGYYANPAFDAMIDEAATLSGTDRAKAETMFIEAQRMLITDAAAVFIVDKPNIHVIRSDVKGYADNPAYGHIVFVNDLSR